MPYEITQYYLPPGRGDFLLRCCCLPPSAESTGMEHSRRNGNVQLWTSHMMMVVAVVIILSYYLVCFVAVFTKNKDVYI